MEIDWSTWLPPSVRFDAVVQDVNCNSDPRSPLLRETRFVTFDGSLSVSTWLQRPDRYRHLECDWGRKPRIGRGGGYSYVAASFGKGVIVQEMSAFNRITDFDGRNNVRVEAGMSLDRLLAWALPRNLYLPVMPGYPQITIGGCIAADVHGKNPMRDGTFADWVEAITLYHPAKGYLSASRLENRELFETTCGGFGLTGLIVDATVRLAPVRSAGLAVSRVPLDSIVDTINQLQTDVASEFAFSWHDGTARNAAFGRGILFKGAWCDDAPTTKRHYRPLSAAQRAGLPWSFWNRGTLRAANSFFRRSASGTQHTRMSVFDAEFPFAGRTLYHRLFGNRGFLEVQLLVPDASIEHFVAYLTDAIARFDPTLTMMSLKTFSGRQQSISLSGKGVLFALDLIPGPRTDAFLDAIDQVLLDLRVQPNIAKDSRLPGHVAAHAIPAYASFNERLRRIDPDRLYQSELSRRIGL